MANLDCWIPMVDSENNTYRKGQWGEKIAQKYLTKKGLKVVHKNYHAMSGEIDLIMQDGHDIVFVEVRYRSSNQFYSAMESIDKKKCRRIIKTSEYYIQQYPKTIRSNCRFDVVAIDGNQKSFSIEWIKNAFQV